MKTVRRKTILLVIAVALVLSISIGTAFAYFSDRTEAKGEATLTLGGKTELHDEYKTDQKTVSVENIGETRIAVRVAVYAPVVNGQTATVTKGDGWEGPIGEGDTKYYYYNKILEPQNPGKTTTNLIVNTEYMLNADLGDLVDVVVTQECVQITYDENGNVKLPTGWANVIK